MSGAAAAITDTAFGETPKFERHPLVSTSLYQLLHDQARALLVSCELVLNHARTRQRDPDGRRRYRRKAPVT